MNSRGCIAASARVEPIRHGGDLACARRRFPDAPTPWIDLSTGINPVPYPFAPPPPAAFTRLPEPASLTDLQAVAAAAYGVADPAMVVAAPGTQILINLLPRLFQHERVAVLGPTYAEHAACWRAAGAVVREVSRVEHVADEAAVALCNPNNPDGRVLPPADLLALASGGRLVVVDEAFADFAGADVSVASRLIPGMVVLRSFGKAFGLAGVRLGFALALPETAALIRAALGPWVVSGVALAIGAQALADRAWLARTGARLAEEAARLDGLLARAGFPVAGGTALFRLVESPDAAALFERLGRAGIFVRIFREQPHRLRLGLPAPDAWPRLTAALGHGRSVV